MSHSEITLPHAVDVERNVLGAIFLNNKLLPQVAELLTPDTFYWPGHQTIYAVMQGLAAVGAPIDPITVAERLEAMGKLEAVGGIGYVSDLIDGFMYIENVEAHAKIVRGKALLRRLIAVGLQIASKAQEGDADAAAIAVEAARLFSELVAGTTTGGLVPFLDIFEARMTQLEQLANNSGQPIGIPTGLHTYDEKTGGLQRADLILLAARPSVGKTSLALDWLISAVSAGYKAAFFSAEMNDRKIIDRALSSRWSIDSTCFLTGKFHPSDWSLLLEAHAWAIETGGAFRIDDSSGPRPAEMRAKCLAMKAEVGLDLVVVDYIQLAEPDRRFDSQNLAVGNISKGLKRIAKDLNVPVVALSQLSRDGVKGNRRPILSDLRDSGSLEQDADVVAFLHRPNEEDREFIELIIGKQRNGPTGIVNLRFDGSYTRFSPWVGPSPYEGYDGGNNAL